jgi:hypothetical protein
MANTIQIGADTTGFVAGVGRAERAMRGLGDGIRNATQGGAFENIASGLKGLIGGIGVFAALKSAATQFYSALDAGGDLVDLGAQTGVAIDKLMLLQMAFKHAGLGAEAVQPTLSKLQRTIAEAANGSVDARNKFADMGVRLDDIMNLSPDEQLEKVSDAILKIENPAQRAAAAIDIFGKGGAKLLALFSAGGLDDIQETIGNQAKLMLVNAGVFDKASEVLGSAGTKVQGFFVGVASEVMPQIMEVIEALNKIDLSYIGQAFGDAIAFWINYFKNFGTQGELIYNTLKLAFMQAVNFLDEEIRVLFAQVAASAKNVFKGREAQDKAIKQAEITARARGPLLDTTETENAIQKDVDTIEASKEATRKKAIEDNPVKSDTDSGAGFLGKTKASTGPAIGLPDISSLQKVGGGSGLLGVQDNSPAYQSVRIQEDIRDYMKTLIDVVKQGGQDFQVAPSSGSGMVLTA